MIFPRFAGESEMSKFMRNLLSLNSQFFLELVLERSSGRINVRQPVHLLREVSPDPLVRTELPAGTQQRN